MIVNGTIAQIQKIGEVTVKIVDCKSGQLYAVTTVKFDPEKNFSYSEDSKKLKIYKTSTEKLEKANRIYSIYNTLKERKPGLFLFSLVDRKDMLKLKNSNPVLFRKLLRVRNIISQRPPAARKKFRRLRRGIKVMKKYAPDKYELMDKEKMKIIESGI